MKIFNEVLGREVEAPDHPRRIISLSPAITETLFMLGLGDRVTGVSAFCARPAEARTKRKVGSYSSTNRDLLREMKPDLILTITGYQRGLALALSDEFPVYPFELPVSVAGIVDSVVKVGLVVGEASRGRELSARLVGAAGASVRPSRTRPRAYVEIDLGGPVTFGAYSHITDAIRLVGGSSLFDEERCEWLKPDLSRVAEADPDVILFEAKMYSRFGPGDLDLLVQKRGWKTLRAVRAGRCHLAPGPLDFLAHHGPSFITESLPWLSQTLAGAEEAGRPL